MISNKTVLNNTKIFSSFWWQKTFLKDTQDLTKTCVFKNCLNTTDIEDLKKEVLHTINTVCNLKTDEFGFRIWFEGKLASDKEKKFIYNNPIKENETIENWSKRIFKNKKFGIILNAAEVLNYKLTQKIALKIKPLLVGNGMPLRGFNITLFIGNYGFTPLGIHKDPPGESVIHFHLGPAKKTIYQWHTEELEQTIKNKGFSFKDNVHELLPLATTYTFNESDLYFMPSKKYHIGQTKEFSIGIALWSNKNFKEELSKEIMRNVENEYIIKSEKINHQKINTLQEMKEIESYFKAHKYQNNLTFKALCKETYRDSRYSLFSNCGFPKVSLSIKKKRVLFNIEDFFILELPFKIEYYNSTSQKENLIVFVRGNKIILKKNRLIIDIINLINLGQVVPVKKILTNNRNEKINEDICSLLSTLEFYCGIKKVIL